MKTLHGACTSLGWLILVACAATGLRADDRTPADLLPRTALGYLEVRRPVQALSDVEQHPLAERALALEPVWSAMQQEKYVAFRGLVALVEVQTALPWRDIVARGFGGGIAFAWDSHSGGVALIAKSTDGSAHAKLLETLIHLAALDAQNKKEPNTITVSEYRGHKVYAVDDYWIVAASDWLVATDRPELRSLIIDRVIDAGPADSLASDEQFGRARQAADASAMAWAYVNLAMVREKGLAAKAFTGRSENLLAEILLGGVLTTLQQTPYLTVELMLDDEHVQLRASAPHDRGWAGDLREHYFGPQGVGAAPRPLAVEDAILSLAAHRDVSAMWLRAADLMDEPANEQLAQADSNLSTLFSGKDFGQDVLGAFEPPLRLVVARQRFADGEPAPAIKLPAFGLVAELKDPAASRPELRRTFQNLVGFFNIVGAMNGQPQLELAMETTETCEVVAASHLPDAGATNPTQLRINYNFSPAVAFAGTRFVVATTRELAAALATAPERAAGSDARTDRVVNSHVILDASTLGLALADNLEHLIAQNMLEKGHTRVEAERELAVLLEVVQWFNQLAFRLETESNQLQISLDLAFDEP